MKKFYLNAPQRLALWGTIGIGLVGALGLLFLGMRLHAARMGLQHEEAALRQAEVGPFSPTQANLAMLQRNSGILQQRLEKEMAHFHSVEKNPEPLSDPILFKQQWAEGVRILNLQAVESGIRIGPNAEAFGFGLYQNRNPNADALPQMEPQWDGIRHVAQILLQGKVPITSLDAVCRTNDTDGNGAEVQEDALHGKIWSGKGGMYTVYPLELEFTGKESALREVLIDLAEAPAGIVVRMVTLHNSRPAPPRIDELIGASALTPASAGNPISPLYKPVFVTALGNEELSVRLRIDWIVWKQGKLK